MNVLAIGLIGILVLIIMLFSRMPVAFAIFLVGLVSFSYVSSLDNGLTMISKDFLRTFTWYTMTLVPMFTLMGFFAYASGMSARLFEAAYVWLGQYRGGLAMAVIVASAFFGAICGSSSATAATMGIVSLPQMKKYKYDASLATASVACGSILGIMIPPSGILLIYGIVTENSIGALFLAGVLPGIMLASLFVAVIYFWTRLHPEIAPAADTRVKFKTKVAKFGGGTLETLLIFSTVMGLLIFGITTATEAGGIGVMSLLLLGLARRKYKWREFNSALAETTKITALVYTFVAAVAVFSRFLAVTHVTDYVAYFITELDIPRYVVMMGILFVYFFFGCFVDPMSFMLLTIPVFYPVVLLLGYDPIWYGVIMVCCCGTGGVTPPVGIMVYIVGEIDKEVPIQTIFRGVWPFLGAMLVGVILLFAFPQIATFLPNLLMPVGGGG